MIKDLDLTLKALLSGEAEPGSELAAANISFSIPDEEWHGKGNELELNIYLYDIRENRELRTNERELQRNPDGTVTRKEPLPRIDCAYILTAWNKVSASTDEDKEMQEHRLLSQALRLLLRNPKIPRSFLIGLLVNQEPDLPMVTAQQGGLPDPVEFWNALGSPLRPSINCVVTISLDLEKRTTVPMVQSQITKYEQQGEPGSSEEIIREPGGISDTVTVAAADKPAISIRGVGKEYAVRLQEKGIDTVEELLKLSTTKLARILKKGGTESLKYYKAKADNILEAAQKGLYDRGKKGIEE